VNNNKQETKFILPPDPCLDNPTLQQCVIDPCEENPDLPECVVDPCEENPELEGCQEPLPPEDPCEENPSLPECEIPTEEFTTEGIDCELQPEQCEENIAEIPNVPLEETEEEELMRKKN
jgi:hypothetical protein